VSSQPGETAKHAFPHEQPRYELRKASKILMEGHHMLVQPKISRLAMQPHQPLKAGQPRVLERLDRNASIKSIKTIHSDKYVGIPDQRSSKTLNGFIGMGDVGRALSSRTRGGAYPPEPRVKTASPPVAAAVMGALMAVPVAGSVIAAVLFGLLWLPFLAVGLTAGAVIGVYFFGKALQPREPDLNPNRKPTIRKWRT
jgi:hypothetical protein